ncbi:hypothetical protein LCGC14_1463120 [marine sediment metagenome]|uniref:Uncharacterized protein n=1 Tax=marine sediment metagenome TaxID=412755 RepID=A0A0F9MGH2_9ZZZZ
MPVLDPPVPLSAVFAAGPSTLTLTFSHPLVGPQAGDPGNWFIRFDNFERIVTGVAINPGNVVLDTAMGGILFGDDAVSYSPPPFNIISDTAKPTRAPAFAEFPVTV